MTQGRPGGLGRRIQLMSVPEHRVCVLTDAPGTCSGDIQGSDAAAPSPPAHGHLGPPPGREGSLRRGLARSTQEAGSTKAAAAEEPCTRHQPLGRSDAHARSPPPLSPPRAPVAALTRSPATAAPRGSRALNAWTAWDQPPSPSALSRLPSRAGPGGSSAPPPRSALLSLATVHLITKGL